MIGAIDIGGTKIALGLEAQPGRVVRLGEIATAPVRRDAAAGLAGLREMLRAGVAESHQSLHGIGIGCTGPVDPMTGVMGNVDFLPGWAGINLVEELGGAFGVPAAVENDADAAALAESWFGAGRGLKRFLYVTVSTGIGGGFVLDGRIYRGAGGAHPEVGHHVLEAGGPACTCGSRGCWEALASGPAMAGWFHGQDPARATADAREICRLAADGDALAGRAVERQAVYLGLGLANLINLFAPDAIALGGGVMRSWPLFDARCRAAIRSCCAFVPTDNTALGPALLGDGLALTGAACVWRSRFDPTCSQTQTTPTFATS